MFGEEVLLLVDRGSRPVGGLVAAVGHRHAVEAGCYRGDGGACEGGLGRELAEDGGELLAGDDIVVGEEFKFLWDVSIGTVRMRRSMGSYGLDGPKRPVGYGDGELFVAHFG